MNIVIQGVVSAEDVALACSLHRRGGVLWKAIAVAVALYAAMVSRDAMLFGVAGQRKSALQIALVAAGLIVFAFLSPRRWRPHETSGHQLARVVTDEGIHVRDGAERCFIPWKQVARGRLCDRMGIIYLCRTSAAYIYPRHMFLSEEDWNSFCNVMNIRAISL